jgi:hypothetical protein
VRDLARRCLEAEAARVGVSLDPADVLVRRAEGIPEVHLAAPADELLAQLLRAEGNVAGIAGTLMTRARIGPQALLSRIEESGALVPH